MIPKDKFLRALLKDHIRQLEVIDSIEDDFIDAYKMEEIVGHIHELVWQMHIDRRNERKLDTTGKM